jgi:hypothetical protein
MSRTDTRKPSRIAEFLIVTFVISWGCWALVLIHGGDYSSGINLPFFVLASFGPLLAALLMRLLHGRTIRIALRRPRRFQYLLVALALVTAGTIAGIVGGAATGQSTFDFHDGLEALTSYGNPVLFLPRTAGSVFAVKWTMIDAGRPPSFSNANETATVGPMVLIRNIAPPRVKMPCWF